jgi:tetratricopeptide (TPR) repeat protein
VLVLFILSAISVLAPAKFDIQGQIINARRVDAPALLRLLSGNTIVQTTAADPRGHFRFRKIDPGSYVIHVESDGYYGQDIPVQLSDSISNLDITLTPTADNPLSSATFDPFRSLDIPAKAKKEFNLGVLPQKDGKCDGRITHLQKAVAIYPQYGEAFTEIARCYVQMNDLAAAETAFKSAAQFSDGVYATVNLATLYLNQGRLDEAQALITPLLQKRPTEGELYAAQARIYYAKGRTREAELAALEAHERGHKSPDMHLILAKIYQDQGRRSALLTQLMTYLDENPRGAAADQVRREIQEIAR